MAKLWFLNDETSNPEDRGNWHSYKSALVASIQSVTPSDLLQKETKATPEVKPTHISMFAKEKSQATSAALAETANELVSHFNDLKKLH